MHFSGTITLSIVTFSIMTLSIKGLFATFSIKDTQHNPDMMLIVI
jgi:hypothetical protein